MFSRVLTYARHHAIAVAALFIALGGTSYAAGRTVLTSNVDSSTVLACQAPAHAKGAGVLVIVKSFAQCPKGYLHFSWSKTGPAGNTGPQGGAGLTGDQGLTGSNGAAGLQGFTGLAGATGNAGVAGSNGATGNAGAAGSNGTDGSNGVTGNAGVAGSNGTDGSNGATGNAGSTGATGAAGSNGTDGIQGPQGPQGDTGNAGSDGATGPAGATGAAGPTASAFTSADSVYTLIGGSDTTVLTTTIDPSFAGNLLLNSSLEFFFTYSPGPVSQVTCNAYVDGDAAGTIEDSVPGDAFTTMPLTGAIAVSAGSHTVTIACNTPDPDTDFLTGNLTVVAASS